MTKSPISATKTDGGAAVSSIPMPMSGDFSLYFHIPFCKKKCAYCHFYVIPEREDHKEALLKGLLNEFALQAPLIPKSGLVSVYFGGGTPSLLPPTAFETILRHIGRLTSISSKTEITLEANPDFLTQSAASDFLAAGINRLSLGVQSLDDTLLNTLSRRHSAKKAKNAILSAKSAGIDNLSIDLMYDIPGQTKTSFTRTLTSLRDLPIDHLSLYNLTFEEGTLFYKKRSDLQKTLPDGKESAWMYQEAQSYFQSIGKPQYEISAFATPGKQSKHNTGYWQARPFLGFGPSAFSYWRGSRFRNIPHLKRYLDRIHEKVLPVDFFEHLPQEKRQKELLAIAIRMLEGVFIPDFEKRHGPLSKDIKKSLCKLKGLGLLMEKEKRLYLSEKGILFYDSVAEELI